MVPLVVTFGFALALAPPVPFVPVIPSRPDVPGPPGMSGRAPSDAVDPAAHRREVEVWRQARDARLRSDTGWLTLAGLYWLRPGVNRFGAAAGNDLVLPAGGPPHGGTLHLAGGQVTIELAPGVAATAAGHPVTKGPLRSDAGGAQPDVLSVGALTLQIIERQGRLAVRVKDRQSEVRRNFKGMAYYAIDPRYRVVAEYTPHAQPRSISVPNVLGSAESLPSPGTATFQLDGKTYRLDPVIEAPGDTQLFFIFRDRTAGKTTYGAGRFVYADPPADLLKPGRIVLDFNKAYSPPCAFTPFATCPLPPQQNRLPVSIEAGERFDGHASHP